jgi:hypothetical protein
MEGIAWEGGDRDVTTENMIKAEEIDITGKLNKLEDCSENDFSG